MINQLRYAYITQLINQLDTLHRRHLVKLYFIMFPINSLLVHSLKIIGNFIKRYILHVTSHSM